MSIEFEKFHGTGNDFVVVDADEYVPDRGAFAREVCDRRDGVQMTDGGVTAEQGEDPPSVGADGTLFLALEPKFSPPRAVMTLVQPDGSTAAMCGNGARCAAKWAAERTGADTVMLDTQAGTRRAEIADDEVTIEMGAPSFAPSDVPLAEGRDEPLVRETVAGVEVTAVNTGVPHAVAFVEDVDEVDLDELAPAIRHAEVFPEGANVNVASRRDDGRPAFDQRTYERGVEGETRACGTGAVAIAAVARRLGRVETDAEAVEVFPPGGRLGVTFRGGRASLTGPVEREFEGEIASTPEPWRVSEA
ncbi:diaminopimelate epimerase [Halorussus gelatinilyticus]|uniref:Diaminopimelate epimerase n=1 Tax=Halorussus gelatinilyticus TaxID=2937524 RepID=A0A8U0IGC6_9EURY|nr:diaminopimelate epimerase [Halorussus gelatinilyticus]UPV99291.1 diaminopimelate epimerase [Halorussus gelatinilyticus]